MTVSNTNLRSPATGGYACDGANQDFAGTFTIQAAEDVDVILRDADGAETTLTLTSDYTVTPATDYQTDSFTVTTVATYDATYTITLIRSMAYTQPNAISNSGRYNPAVVMSNDDRNLLLIQQNAEELNRCVKQNASDPTALDDAAYLAACVAAQTGAETAETGAETAETNAETAEAGAVVAQTAAEAAADAVATNITTANRMVIAAGPGEITESSSIVTTATGQLAIGGAPVGTEKLYADGDVWFNGDIVSGEPAAGGSLTLLGKSGTSNNLTLTTAAVNPSLQLASSSDRFLVLQNTSSGHFGVLIGAPAPAGTEMLHVAGDVYASGDIQNPLANFRYTGDPSTNGSFRSGVVGGVYVVQERIAGTWTTVSSSGGEISKSNAYVISHEQASGTAGGATTATTWSVATFNINKLNNLGVTGAANSWELPAGDYYVRGWHEIYDSSRCQIRLRNTTGATTLVVGGTAVSGTVSAQVPLAGYFTVAASQTLQVEYYVATGKASDGQGLALTSGEVENYGVMEFYKVG